MFFYFQKIMFFDETVLSENYTKISWASLNYYNEFDEKMKTRIEKGKHISVLLEIRLEYCEINVTRKNKQFRREGNHGKRKNNQKRGNQWNKTEMWDLTREKES